MKCEQRSAVLLNVRVAAREPARRSQTKKWPLAGPVAEGRPLAGPVVVREMQRGYFGTREQSVELMLVLQPEMAEVSGTKEAPRLMTLLRTVTPTKVPA